MFLLSIRGWRLILIAALYAGVAGALIRIAPLPGFADLAAGGAGPESLRDLASIVVAVSAASAPLLLVGALLLPISRRMAGLLPAAVLALNVVGILVLGVEALVVAQQNPDALAMLAHARGETTLLLWVSGGLFLLAFALLLPLGYAEPQRVRARLIPNPRLQRLTEVMQAAAARPEVAPAPLPAPPTGPSEVRRAIRRRIAAGQVATDAGESTLRLVAAHDAVFADALAKLPERHGRGGAVLGELVREMGPSFDPVALARMVAAALLLAPEESPEDDELEALALRIAAVDADAARELAAAHRQLGDRFSIEFSLPRVLHKYGLRTEQIAPSAFAVRPRAAEVEQLLAEGRLGPLNDLLRTFGVIVLERIGSVVPVFRIDDRAGQRVMPAADLIALLGARAAVR